jgi:hypothetical protein
MFFSFRIFSLAIFVCKNKEKIMQIQREKKKKLAKKLGKKI